MTFGDVLSDVRSARLLIVEDEVLLASALQELLRDTGFEVVGTAGSAAAALSLAKDQNPQLALIDVCLVGPIDGIELACRLRDEYRISAIFLSGVADPEARERALMAQPLGFLRKPYRASQVYNAIQKALDGQLSE